MCHELDYLELGHHTCPTRLSISILYIKKQLISYIIVGFFIIY